MIRFRHVSAADEPAAGLIAAMVAEIESLYGEAVCRGPSATATELGPPGGACVVGFEDGHAVCVGGVKDLGGGVCEIKRMYVAPEARGRGHARALLAALERAARDLGHRVVRLDTGPSQPHAEALYRSAGYREIADYNGNPAAAYWGERRL